MWLHWLGIGVLAWLSISVVLAFLIAKPWDKPKTK